MGIKTSVYLSDRLDAAVRASGLPMAELIRRGLEARGPEEAAARLAAERVVEAERDEIAEIVRREVRAALRDAHGGSL